jgi:AcrR family transcriptional regulator
MSERRAARRERRTVGVRAERPSAKPRAARLSASERRDHLLEVARSLLAAEGPEALRLPRLAETAGVSKPVVYDHFPTRHALIATLLREYGTYVIQQLTAAVSRHRDDQEAAIRAATHAYFECVATRGASLARLSSAILADPEMRAAGQRYRDKVFTLFAEGFARMSGLPAADIMLPAAMLVAAGEEAIHQWESGRTSRELAEETQIELILAAMTRRDRWIGGSLARARRKRER